MTQRELDIKLLQLQIEQYEEQEVLDKMIEAKKAEITAQEIKLNILKESLQPEINDLRMRKRKLCNEFDKKKLILLKEIENAKQVQDKSQNS